MSGDDRFDPGMPRQSRKKGIDQSAGNKEQMTQAFASKRMQNKIGAERHQWILVQVQEMGNLIRVLRPW